MKFNRNLNIFIGENTFENVVCKTSAILSGPQCVHMTGAIIHCQTSPV